jgi:hypothetical protein
MAACETCWAEASRRAAYSAEAVADIYPKVLAENKPWTPERPCGGIETSVNGAPAKPWTWCEVHMQPRGHFDRHPHTRPIAAEGDGRG